MHYIYLSHKLPLFEQQKQLVAIISLTIHPICLQKSIVQNF